jgi:uncharacterized protein YcbX
MDIRLSAIHLYPVKGIGGVTAAQAKVEPEGLRHDRRWMIVDDQDNFLSQRSHPRLALLTGSFDGHKLELAAPGQDPLSLDIPDGRRRITVTVWRDRVDAAATRGDADEWISRYLGQSCRLAYMDETCLRPISSSRGRPGESVSFADGYPCLLISAASLADLNCRLETPLPMDRFRPNLVVDGCDAFAEDGWQKLAIGETVYRFAGLCARCSVTTVDQQSGTRESKEPLRTLATYRQGEGGVVFGVNLVPEKTGAIAVGDKVVVLG